MHGIPDCQRRRYQALDELITELSDYITSQNPEELDPAESGDNASMKLTCDLWKILRDEPEMDLSQALRMHLNLSPRTSQTFQQKFDVYTCGKPSGGAGGSGACGKDKKQGSSSSADSSKNADKDGGCCKGAMEPPTPPQDNSGARSCCDPKAGTPKSTSKSASKSANAKVPLSKVLCNLKEAVSFDKKCNIKVGELMMMEKQLQDQVAAMEEREKDGVTMLKQAECMWSCMENAYKKKIAESVERQNALMKKLKEIEASNNKWRKTKKDLEFQLNNINNCQVEIRDKINEKVNDAKSIQMEVDNYKKRIEANKKETEAVKKSFSSKKSSSDAKIAKITEDVKKTKSKIDEEKKRKYAKEQEGTKYVKEARNDLQEISTVLLKKKLENEDLRAEKESILQEIELLTQTCEQCKDKCKNKQEAIMNEIAKVDAEIKGFKVRCIKCHECTDTGDVRKLCTDCPRCVQERDCLTEDDHCCLDPAMDCVCMSVKQKFLDNVFENMYTVLERQAKTPAGKVVADSVLKCLRKSINGKLSGETRKMLHEFVLGTVKKNLNLTIIGGAVKTRCEMDQDTYKQLMLCLTQVRVEKAPKVDKGTISKKEACKRWGGPSECNCPRGPKSCVCTRLAPPNPKDPQPSQPPAKDPEDASNVPMCPHKASAPCGPDCAMHSLPSAVAAEVAAWKPAPCDERQCQFSRNMRAAQCILGPDSLTTDSKAHISTAPYVPCSSSVHEQMTCSCGPSSVERCKCQQEIQSHPREIIIEEVMGRLSDVTPIQKKKSENYSENDFFMQPDESDVDESAMKKDTLEIKCNSISKEINKLSKSKNEEKENITSELKKLSNSQNKTSTQSTQSKNVNFVKSIEIPSNDTGEPWHEAESETSNEQQQPSITGLRASYLNLIASKHICIKKIKITDKKQTENIVLKIRESDDSIDLCPARMTQTKSGTKLIAFDVVPSLIDVMDDNQEHSVLFTKCESGEYLLDLNGPVPNAMLRISNSGILLVDEIQTKVNSYTNNLKPGTHNFFKMTIKDADQKIAFPPAVLKETSSHNFIIVIDKEFENYYKDTIRQNFQPNHKYPVNLSKTAPDEYLIEPTDSKEGISNAVLVSSPSGDINILVHDTDSRKFLDSNKNLDKTKSFPELPESLMSLLVQPQKDFCTIKSQKIYTTKSSSDSYLYEKVKIKVQDQKKKFTEPTAVLKRSSSGQYSVVLEKESKKSFIKDLKTFLKSNPNALIPVKKSDSGDIIINLDSNNDTNGQYGSLKITPSGNIFLILKEKNAPRKSVTIDDNPDNVYKDVHEDTKVIENPVNECVSTNCNAIRDSSCCDFSKCICAEILQHGVDESGHPHFCKTNQVRQEFGMKTCNMCPENCCLKTFDENTNNKLPHIVIKPCSCQINTKNKFIRNNHHFYYVTNTESVCPFHKDRYNNVSNELLEISGNCNTMETNKSKNKSNMEKSATIKVNTSKEENQNFDYLESMPPQLPFFLRNFQCV